MKCPKCNGEQLKTIRLDRDLAEGDFAEQCLFCNGTFNVREAIDPAKLRELVEKAKNLVDELFWDSTIEDTHLNGRNFKTQ